MRSQTESGKLLRVAGYVRVSALMGREGDDFHSPEVQREKIEAWAAYRDAEVVKWYVDLDVSGTGKVRRPEFERMMTDARAGRFGAVVVYRLTRFARSVQDAATRYRELRGLGINLVSVTEDIDTTTASGQFMQNILFSMAEFESQRIGEEWRNVHARRRARGIAHVALGLYGYRVEGAEIVDVDPDTAPAVELMFKLRREGGSYTMIRRELAANGYRPARGGSHFPVSTLRDMLRNPLYAGLIRNGEGELVEAQHAGLIEPEVFRAVQTMAQRSNEAAPFRASLLSGLVRCSGCGGKMVYNSTGPSGGPAIYRCRARTRSSASCAAPVAIRAEPTNEYVESVFLARFDPGRMPNGGKVRLGGKTGTAQRKAGQLRARADDLTRGLDRLAEERYVRGTLPPEEYQRQFEMWSMERAEALEQAEELDRVAELARPAVVVDALSLWPDATLHVKQRALRRIIDHVKVNRSAVRGGSHDRGIDFTQRLEIGWID